MLFELYDEKMEDPIARPRIAGLIKKLIRIEFAWRQMVDTNELDCKGELSPEQIGAWRIWWIKTKDLRDDSGFPTGSW